MSIAGQLVFAAVLFVGSSICLLFPRKIQAYAVRTAKFVAVRSLVQSAEYVLIVRAAGLVALGMGLIMTWLTLWGPGD
jgi:hypothetical protein